MKGNTIHKVELGDLLKVKGGYAFKSESFTTNGIPIIRIGNLDGNKVIIGQDLCYPKSFLDENRQYAVCNGDILIAMSGATTGKVGIYLGKSPSLLNQRVGKFEIEEHDKIDSKYLLMYLKSDDFKQSVNKLASGCAQPNISSKQLEAIEIPLPHLNTQKKIADILEKAEKAIEKRNEADRLADEYLKSVFVEMFGDPVSNHKGWNIKSLENVIIEIRYGTSTPPVFSEFGYYFIRATNIKNGSILMTDMKYINDVESEKISKCKVDKGDMLIVRSGVNTGDSTIINEEFSGHYAGYDLIIKFNEKVNPVFVNSLFNSVYLNKIIKPLTRRAAQPHLNAEQVKSLKIIHPPIDLQNQFAQIVQKVEAIKQAQKQSGEELNTLFKSFMQKAFRGEL